MTTKNIRLITTAVVAAALMVSIVPLALADNAVPTITSISPTSVPNSDTSFSLTVTGTNFVPDSRVLVNNIIMPTTFSTSTQLNATIPAGTIANNNNYAVTVSSPGPGGGVSNSQTLTVGNATSSAPTINSISPSATTAGNAGLILTVSGSNFVPGSIVSVNGQAKTTSFISATQLTAPLAASNLVNAGTLNITVVNPAPNASTSNAQTFTVNPVGGSNNPVPSLTSISPASVMAGGGNFSFSAFGSNFVPGAVIWFNGTPMPTTFISGSQVNTTMSASNTSVTGTYSVAVSNPGPGGGTSNVLTLAVTPNGSTPGLPNTGIAPSDAKQGVTSTILVILAAICSIALGAVVTKYLSKVKR